MPGLAQTDAFMLGTASILLGPVADLMILEKSHSVGLVKNFVLKSTPSFTELTQGIKNTLVHSTMTGNDVEASAEMFEFTGRNVSYAASLDGSDIVAPTAKNLPGTVASTTTLTMLEADVTKFTAGAEGVGDMIMIQLEGDDEQIMVRRVTTGATTTLTIDTALPASFDIGAEVLVSRCNNIALGSQANQPFLACKVVGELANGDEAVILMPKIRITSGLNYAFKSDNYDHIPLTFKLFDLVSTDPFFTMFQKVGPEKKPAKAMLSMLQ